MISFGRRWPWSLPIRPSRETKRRSGGVTIGKKAAFEDRPNLARDAYVAVARATLLKGEQIVEGLHDLLNDEAFLPFRKDITLQFLHEFPNASPLRLDELLRSVLAMPAAYPEFLALARDVVSGALVVDAQQRDLWLATAYFASPQEFEEQVEREAQDRPSLVWLLRDLSGYQRLGDEQQPLGLPLTQVEFLVRVTGSLFPEAGFPSDGWSGDTNPLGRCRIRPELGQSDFRDALRSRNRGLGPSGE